ncbi:MAG: hypothetical protein HY376_03530 [Candidatus Blackburnbacteria bacterium]|nr:hypothetical protein [Candidatus Blackburnbacteria bacterium]
MKIKTKLTAGVYWNLDQVILATEQVQNHIKALADHVSRDPSKFTGTDWNDIKELSYKIHKTAVAVSLWGK